MELQNTTKRPCAFCSKFSLFEHLSSQLIAWSCPRCGDYQITGSAEAIIHKTPLANTGAISGWIREQNGLRITPTISSDTIPFLLMLVPPPFSDRAEFYLRTAVKTCPRLNQDFAPNAEELIGASYSRDEAEVTVIKEFLQDKGYIRSDPMLDDDDNFVVTAYGRIAADEIAARRARSSQAFVAMWFSDEMKAAYASAIAPAISGAGFSPMMIGSKEHANKIDDEIISEIRRSAFLIADFTGHRGGVYFEAGFAMGLGLRVIWTCKVDDLKELHFDIRQYNCIDWIDAADRRKRLQQRITALFGQGPVASA